MDAHLCERVSGTAKVDADVQPCPIYSPIYSPIHSPIALAMSNQLILVNRLQRPRRQIDVDDPIALSAMSLSKIGAGDWSPMAVNPRY
jgi:hypothetical protein